MCVCVCVSVGESAICVGLFACSLYYQCVCVCAQMQFVWVCECNFYEFVYCLREEFVSVWVAICVFLTVCGRNLCARGCLQFCGCEREHFICVRVCFV